MALPTKFVETFNIWDGDTYIILFVCMKYDDPFWEIVENMFYNFLEPIFCWKQKFNFMEALSEVPLMEIFGYWWHLQ